MNVKNFPVTILAHDRWVDTKSDADLIGQFGSLSVQPLSPKNLPKMKKLGKMLEKYPQIMAIKGVRQWVTILNKKSKGS